MKNNHSGAPRGGRVHWLLWHLKGDFKRSYVCYMDYSMHKYVFARYLRRQLYDVFIVYRTSAHWFTCTYANRFTFDFQHFGDHSAKHIALRMWFLFKRYEFMPVGKRSNIS